MFEELQSVADPGCEGCAPLLLVNVFFLIFMQFSAKIMPNKNAFQ